MRKDRAEKKSNSRGKRLLNYLSQTRPGEWLKGQWDSHPARLIGLLLLGGAVISFILDFVPGKLFEDFSANFATEMLSIAITVLLIDALNRRQRNKELKAQLIRQMGSRYPDVAVTAASEMRYHGWGFGEDVSLEFAWLVSANLEGAELSGANLKRAWLSGANLQGARLGRANLEKTWLNGANLQGAMMYLANLQGADLNGANLKRARLSGANLQGASLGRANLQGADLNGANLKRARLSGANLQGARLGGANLERAWLPGANLQGAEGTTPHQLKETRTLMYATMPDGSGPEEWALKLFDEGKIDEETYLALAWLGGIGPDEETYLALTGLGGIGPDEEE